MTAQVFKILSILLLSCILGIVLKQKNSEYALLVGLAAGVVTAIMIFSMLSEPISELKREIESYGVEPAYFKVAIKALGLGYISSFIADACRDSGQTALASKAELAGKAAIFIISLPLLKSVLNIALGFVK